MMTELEQEIASVLGDPNVYICPDEFAQWVEIVKECAFHNGWIDHHAPLDRYGMKPWRPEPYANVQDHAWQTLNYFDCPPAWRWPVWLFAQGECYYGADGWTQDQHDIDHHEAGL